jgi:hypothetical protein
VEVGGQADRGDRHGVPRRGDQSQTAEVLAADGRQQQDDREAAVAPSARAFASHEMKDPAELAVGVSPAGFEFDRGRRRDLL